MMYHNDLPTIWQFETDHFGVRLQVRPCDDDPADSFEFGEDIEAVRNGSVEWFDAVVTVYRKLEDREVELGWDSLCCCAYRSFDEFVTGHRDSDPMNRNSSLFRAKYGENHVICHYFPSMVREAIADARAANSTYLNVELHS